MIVLWLEVLLSEVEIHALALSVINVVAHVSVSQELLALVILISINRCVASLGWTHLSLVGEIPVIWTSHSWTIAILLVQLLLLIQIGSEDLL